MKAFPSKKKATPLISLATLWMSGVAADAGVDWSASSGAWGTSHSAVVLRRHAYEDPVNTLVRNSYSMPFYSNSLMRQQGSHFQQKSEARPSFALSESADGTIELTMEVPGSTVRDISVELENDKLLRVSGFRNHHKNGYISQKRFDEVFQLNDNADVDKLNVNLSSGLLTVTVPRKPTKTKQLRIATSDPGSILDSHTSTSTDAAKD